MDTEKSALDGGGESVPEYIKKSAADALRAETEANKGKKPVKAKAPAKAKAKPKVEVEATEPTKAPVKAKAKRKVAAKAPAKANGKRVVAKPRKTVKAKAKDNKTAAVIAMLTSKAGCTRADILKRTGWPSVSVQAMAKQARLKLRQVKVQGEVIRYFAK